MAYSKIEMGDYLDEVKDYFTDLLKEIHGMNLESLDRQSLKNVYSSLKVISQLTRMGSECDIQGKMEEARKYLGSDK